MNRDPKSVVAAFDFDGTISYRDSLLPFLVYTTGIFKTYFYLFLELPSLLGFVFKIISRQRVKEKILKRFFNRMDIKKLKELGNTFAKEKLPKLIRPEAIKRIQWHQNQNHRCILISASLDIYLKPWSESVGFSDSLTSSLEINLKDEVTGKLQGINCREEEKVRRLEKLCGSKDNYVLYAYGDSRGDQELLNYADYPFYRKMQ